MSAILGWITAFSNWFWGLPILLLIGFGGLYINIRLGFIQIKKVGYIFSQTFGSIFKKSDTDGVSGFAAACSALGSTIGASNIVGVPLAIALGGPGAVFWMWILAIIGAATKYTEIALCLKYRTKNEKGEWVGSSYSYIKELFGGKTAGKVIAIIAAATMFLQILPSLGTQAISAASNLAIFGLDQRVVGVGIGVFVAVLVFGGIKRISAVLEKLVPIMSILYVAGVLVVLAANAGNILPSIGSIFAYAFKPHAAVGGFAGSTVAMALRWGSARGIYSNEAGFGSAPTAHCAAEVDHPIRQAMWGVFEVTVDTLIVCTATALAVLSSGVWVDGKYDAGTLAQGAFAGVFGVFGDYFVAICVTLFVITTSTVLVFYAERQAQFLFHTTKTDIPVRIIAIAIMVLATFGMELTAMYQVTDFFTAIFIIPNMVAVIWMVPQVAELTKEFFTTPNQYYLADIAKKNMKKK